MEQVHIRQPSRGPYPMDDRPEITGAWRTFGITEVKHITPYASFVAIVLGYQEEDDTRKVQAWNYEGEEPTLIAETTVLSTSERGSAWLVRLGNAGRYLVYDDFTTD